MKVEVYSSLAFDKQVKKLAKQYPCIENDVQEVINQIRENVVATGSKALGGGLFKIRMPIRSARRSKSDGARVIDFVYQVERKIFLLEIYDKKKKSTLSPDEWAYLKAIAKSIEAKETKALIQYRKIEENEHFKDKIEEPTTPYNL